MVKEPNLIRANDLQKDVIKNLMQFYIYDFSEYLDYDMEYNGLFKPYPGLNDYWSVPGKRFPYLICVEGVFIGFALVNRDEQPKPYFSVAEFFVMKKYRRAGIGRAAALQLFALHQGDWQIHQRENNLPAIKFWRAVIAEFSGGNYFERLENNRVFQNFVSHGADLLL